MSKTTLKYAPMVVERKILSCSRAHRGGRFRGTRAPGAGRGLSPGSRSGSGAGGTQRGPSQQHGLLLCEEEARCCLQDSSRLRYRSQNASWSQQTDSQGEMSFGCLKLLSGTSQ